jgi:inner membrane protein
METNTENSSMAVWQKSRWLVKGLIIGVMALLFMVPMLYVKNLVFERQERQQEANKEITSKWAGRQNIIGPVVGIPFWKTSETDTNKKIITKHIAYFLPGNLKVDATINPKEKHRGIFKVMLYDSKAAIAGTFSELAIGKLNIPADKFIWNEAFVLVSVADNKGLNDQLSIKWKDSTLELTPQPGDHNDGMIALLKANSADDFKNASFSINIDMNGSEQLFFTPVGKSTVVTINSSWKHPSFSGNMLPQSTDVSDNGFRATWKSMAHKRNFPQQWVDNNYSLAHYLPAMPSTEEVKEISITERTGNTTPNYGAISNAAFGVDLFIPVNGYQKTLRTVKYALLCILLTFAAFFLIETSNKKSAHPFQYGLIGLALVLFYTLLLSISEYTGFNTAYLIASGATIALIAWFVKGILASGRAATILSFVLVLVYSYVFSLLQLQDYSLLFGSIGLFITLAVVMYFSKKLKW